MRVEPARILGVHGIRNHAAGATDCAAVARQRSEDWLTMLEKAFTGHPLGRQLDVRVAYFADLLHEEQTIAHGPSTPKVSPHLRLDDDIDEFLRELAESWRARDPSAPADNMALLARKCGLYPEHPERLVWLARRHLSELTNYLSRRDLRDKVKCRVHDELTQFEPHVILGHDLGALVAYDVLTHSVPATSLITMGAPWGSHWVLKHLAQPGRSLSPPATVIRWLDLYSNGDVFCVNRPVGVRVAGGPWQQLCLDDGDLVPIRHDEDESHYLTHPALGEHLTTFLAAAPDPWDGAASSAYELDFYISYAEPDVSWARWIAWALEDNGHRALIRDWDSVGGIHKTAQVQDGVLGAERMICVLSASYLKSADCAEEWQAMLRRDPHGDDRRLITARIENCDRPGLIDVVGCDLFGLSEPQARETLLQCADGAKRGRRKPTAPPPFPGDPKHR